MKRLWKLVCILAILCFCSGCMLTVDEMYRLPKRSDAYYNLQSAIDMAMANMDYCAPLSGENQQSVQMADLDGDGVQEYILFARTTQEKPLRILVFRRFEDSFSHTCTVECNGSAFDQVEYVDVDGDGGLEIVVGRQLSDQVIRSVSVYTYENDGLIQLVGSNYTKFLTVDMDSNGSSELFLLRPGASETDNGVAELYGMKNGVMERYNEVNMSQAVDHLKRIIIGNLDGGKTAVFVASSVDDRALVTDIFVLSDGTLDNAALSNEAGTAVQTFRNYYVYADDIDNDSVVELPHLIDMKPMPDMILADNHKLIRWYAMTPEGEEVSKLYTYHNFVGGWYLQLQDQWASRVVVKNMGQQHDFYVWDDAYAYTQKLFTVYASTVQTREEHSPQEGRVILLKTESTVYSAVLEPGAEQYGINQDYLIYSFRLIQKDWKTGET